MSLYETIEEKDPQWRDAHYPESEFPAIREMLEWAARPETLRITDTIR